MLRKASEVRYNSDEQVAEAIDKALALATRESVPAELRAAVLTAAVPLYAQKHVELEQVQLGANHLAIPQGRRV